MPPPWRALAWIIGWDLILEYAMVRRDSLRLDKYFNEFIETIFSKPSVPVAPTTPDATTKQAPVSWLNVLAVTIAAAYGALIVGIKESATTNAVLVAVKVESCFFIGVGIPSWAWTAGSACRSKNARLRIWANSSASIPITQKSSRQRRDTIDGTEFLKLLADHTERAKPISDDERSDIRDMTSVETKWGAMSLLGLNRYVEPLDDRFRSPFMPYGLSGIMVAAAAVFFAYLGFDAISTHAEEARKPQRDVPIGILTSLAVCTFFTSQFPPSLPAWRLIPKSTKMPRLPLRFGGWLSTTIAGRCEFRGIDSHQRWPV